MALPLEKDLQAPLLIQEGVGITLEAGKPPGAAVTLGRVCSPQHPYQTHVDTRTRWAAQKYHFGLFHSLIQGFNSALGPEMMQAENQSYLPGAGEAAVGDRKSQTPMPSSLQATMSANQ